MALHEIMNPGIEGKKDLGDFTGLEKTEAGVDISQKFGNLFGQTKINLSNIERENLNKLSEVVKIKFENMFTYATPEEIEGIENILKTALS